MSKRRRRYGIVIAVAGVAIVAAGVAVTALLPPWLRGEIERLAGDALGRETKIAGTFDVSLSLTPVLVAEDITIANVSAGSEPEMVRASRLKISLDMRSLWSRPLRVRDAELDGVRVLLETDAQGRGNWKFRKKASPSPAPAAGASKGVPVVFDRVVLRDFEVIFRARRDAPPVTARIEHLEAQLDPATRMIALSASGEINDRPWDVAGRLGTLEGLYDARDVEHAVTGHIGGAKVALRGRIRDPLTLGDPNVEFEIEGADVAAALSTAALRSPVSGPFHLRGRLSPSKKGVELDLTAGLSGVTAAARGYIGALLKPDAIDATVEASGPDASKAGSWMGIDGVPPRPFTIAGRVSRRGARFSFDDVEIRVGETSLTVSGALGEPPRWVGTDLAIAGTGRNLSELSALTRLRLPARRFEARGRFLRRDDALAVEGADIRIDDAIFRGGGTVGEPPRLANLDLSIEASGPDLSRFSGIATFDLPSAPFALRGRIARNGTALDLDGIEGRLGEDTVSVQGSLVPARRLAGTDLRARVVGPDLARAASLAGLTGVPAVSYEVSGHVLFLANGYRLDGVEAHAGRIRATVSGQLGPHPELDGTALDFRVEGAALSDLAAWGVGVGLPGDAFSVGGGLSVENGVYRVDRVAAEAGEDRAVVDGTLGPLPDLSPMDVAVEAAGPRLADIGRFVVAAGGESPKRLPAEPYTVSGRVRRSPAGLELREARATVGNAEILLDGMVGSEKELRGTDVRFEARAPDTSLPSAVAGITLPDGPFALHGRVGWDESAFRLDAVSVSIGDARLEISGTLGEPPKLTGTALDFSAAGPDLSAALGPVTGISPLPSDPFEVSAHVEGSVEHFASRRFAARLGESDLEGSVVVRFEGKPSVEADLRARRLGLPRLLDGFRGEPTTPAEPTPARESPKKGERLIPDEPLSLAALQATDARLLLTAAELLIPGVPLTDVTVAGELRDGALRLDRVEGTSKRGGKATARLALEPRGDGYLLRASGRLADGRLDLSETDDAPEKAPSLDLEFEVAGTGGSLHAIAANSGGSALIQLGPGRMASNLSDHLTSGVLRGLLDALNPFRKSSPYTAVECGVVVMGIEGGMAAVEPIAARTDKLTMIGHGKVDLDTERVDLVWTIKPRKGVGISASSIANPYIKLGGTLASPSLDVKPLEAAASTGAAVATAGLTLLFRGLYDRITAESNVCLKALDEASRKAEAREAGKKP